MSDTREYKLISWNVNGLRAVLKKEPSFTEISLYSRVSLIVPLSYCDLVVWVAVDTYHSSRE